MSRELTEDEMFPEIARYKRRLRDEVAMRVFAHLRVPIQITAGEPHDPETQVAEHCALDAQIAWIAADAFMAERERRESK